jgi:hypothetical protein
LYLSSATQIDAEKVIVVTAGLPECALNIINTHQVISVMKSTRWPMIPAKSNGKIVTSKALGGGGI